LRGLLYQMIFAATPYRASLWPNEKAALIGIPSLNGLLLIPCSVFYFKLQEWFLVMLIVKHPLALSVGLPHYDDLLVRINNEFRGMMMHCPSDLMRRGIRDTFGKIRLVLLR
jgi:hypothetical protein